MQVVYHITVNILFNRFCLFVTEKRCTTCLDFKPFDDFHNDKGLQDGMKPACKVCRKDPSAKSFGSTRFVSSETKICTKCLEEKSYDEFDKGTGKDGHQSHCKECRSQHNQQFRQENIEHFRAYDKSRIGDLKRNAQWMERYYEKYSQDEEYVERKRRNSQKRYQANPLIYREYVNRRIAHKRKAQIGKVSYKRILERDGYFCYLCQKPIDPKDLCFDHIVPLQPRLGDPQGTHSEDNIRPAHKLCNLRKSNKRLDQLKWI